MKRFLLPILTGVIFLLLSTGFELNSQCSVNFGSLGSGLIVESGGLENTTLSYNIWDETTGNCSSSGGVADMTVHFEIIETFDAYGGTPFHTTNGTNYRVEYSASGFRGTLPHGNIAATRSSPGDVRCYKITVNFAPHVNNITAGDFEVDLTSVNTVGTAFESTALAFIDRSGIPYGSYSYAGYYQLNPSPNTHPGVVAVCPNVPPLPNTSGTPWSVSGPGVYTASSNTVNISANSCNPASGTSGTPDNADVLASSTGLASSAGIGGFVFQVCLENVGTFTSDAIMTAVSTTFTSTLNGFSIMGQAMPVKFSHFSINKFTEKTFLTFTTASETNNDFFTIERSGDGRSFDAIGEIKGAGNSTEEKHYEFTDENPLPGINYYRIKQTDFDGQYSYSEIRSVRHTGKGNVAISPRSTDGRLDISTDMESYDVALYSSAGQEVARFAALSGHQTVNIEALQAGIYFVNVMSGTESETVRVVKY